jgi:hypothetical protein
MVPIVVLPLMLCGCPEEPKPVDGYGSWAKDPALAAELAKQEQGTNGIQVGSPKFYDDASLKLMLDQTRARLGAVNGINEAALTGHFGAVTGSTFDQSQFGIQVLGPTAPTVATTNNGATNQTTTNNGLPSGQTSLPATTVVTTNPSQSVVSTTAPTAAALPTLPSGTSYTMPSSMAGSALDVLNEEMQLTYEITNLQLLLEGALSDRFVKNQNFIKPRTTIGFPISITPPPGYHNAVAVVEIEVRTPNESLSDEPPIITTILPREKTYNVAALTDNSTSIGAGAVIHAVSVSGSWFKTHKTYYVVQDQDTIAVERPVDQPATGPKLTRFAWEFRPVLGEKYVRSGLKQTFVQLTLPVAASHPCYGSLSIHTYWRSFDQKTGLAGGVIEGSGLVNKKVFSIPNYNQPPRIVNVEYQDQGDGNVLVRVKGNFLAGTYVQIGATRLDASKGLLMEDSGLSFVVPASALARWGAYVVSRSGQRAKVVTTQAQDFVPQVNREACASDEGEKSAALHAALAAVQSSSNGHLRTLEFQQLGGHANDPTTVTLVNEASTERMNLIGASATSFSLTNPLVTLSVGDKDEVCTNGEISIKDVLSSPVGESQTELVVEFDPDSYYGDDVLLEINHKVWGLSDSPVRRDAARRRMSLVVPTASLIEGRGVRAFRLFRTSPDEPGEFKDDPARKRNLCFSSFHPLTDLDVDAATEKLVFVSTDANGTKKYLLYGKSLANLKVLNPEKAKLDRLDSTSLDRMVLISIAKDDQKNLKKLIVQKEIGHRPVFIDVPTDEPKARKVAIDTPIILNTDELEIPLDAPTELARVKMGDKDLKVTKGKDFIRLTNLRGDGVTNEQKTRELVFEFTDGSKVTVKVDVVAQRVGVK